MINFGCFTVEQPRAAIAAPRKESKIFLYKFYDWDDVSLVEHAGNDDFGACLGYVTIDHPWIMSGDPDEIWGEFLRAAHDFLVQHNDFVTNDHGTLFYIGGAA